MKTLTSNELELVSGGNIQNWMVKALSNMHGGIASDNYRRYRQRRDNDGSEAARERSRSRSDMNSPGDQKSTDKPGGR